MWLSTWRNPRPVSWSFLLMCGMHVTKLAPQDFALEKYGNTGVPLKNPIFCHEHVFYAHRNSYVLLLLLKGHGVFATFTSKIHPTSPNWLALGRYIYFQRSTSPHSQDSRMKVYRVSRILPTKRCTISFGDCYRVGGNSCKLYCMWPATFPSKKSTLLVPQVEQWEYELREKQREELEMLMDFLSGRTKEVQSDTWLMASNLIRLIYW